MDSAGIAHRIEELLGLEKAPTAVAFRDEEPSGLHRVRAAASSGCTYWSRAAEGESFYTEASDHFGCPIGAYTHGVELPPEQAAGLNSVLGMMADVQYIRLEEVRSIPRRDSPFRFALYAPLAAAPFDPDVVLVRGNARQVMLLAEAAHAVGSGGSADLMGRPTCAAVPAAMRSRSGIASLGCIGNRVYTGLADDELYFAVPGEKLETLVGKLEDIVVANQTLEAYHRAKLA